MNNYPNNWSSIKSEFEVDGSLRDIYIYNVDAELWDIFINLVKRSQYKVGFTYNGDEEIDIPESYASIVKLQESGSTILNIFLAPSFQVNCHFFLEKELELDIHPKDVASEDSFILLFDFLSWLSSSLQREVLLCHENSPEKEIMRVESHRV